MNNFYLFCSLLVISIQRCSSTTKSVLCTEEYCEEYVQHSPCPPLDPICSDPTKSLVIPSPTTCNCCEHCFIFQDVGEGCVVGRPGQPLPGVMCKPGTKCVAGICKEMTDPDPDFHPGYECIDKKCHCLVVDGKTKKTIFGTFDETPDLKKEKQCQCSISAYYARKTINELLPVPDLYLPIPRCLPNGQFDPLQCIEGMCGCVNVSTGTWDLSIRKVPVVALAAGNPKCFDEGRHKTGEYYTTCEKETHDLMWDKFTEDMDDAYILPSHKVRCTPDGEYDTKNSQ